MNVFVAILIAIVTAALGAWGGYQYRRQASEKKIGRTEEYAKNLLEDAQRKADEKKKETILEAKEEVLRLKTELDRECRDRRAEVQRSERRIVQREETLDKKTDALEKREEAIAQKQNDLDISVPCAFLTLYISSRTSAGTGFMHRRGRGSRSLAPWRRRRGRRPSGCG